MNTNIDKFPIINKIYNLRLTDAEVKALQEKLPNFIKSLNTLTAEDSELRESTNKIINGMSFCIRKGEIFARCYTRHGVSNSPVYGVEISKIDENTQTNVRNGIDKYISDDGQNFSMDIARVSLVNFKKLNLKDFNDFIKLNYFNSTQRYSENDPFMVEFIRQNSLFTSFKDFKIKLIEAILHEDTRHLINNGAFDNSLRNKKQEVLSLLFPKALHTALDSVDKGNLSHKNLAIITDVFEIKNTRICILTKQQRNNRELSSKIAIITAEDVTEYNYTDVGRYILLHDRTAEHRIPGFGTAFFIDENPSIPKIDDDLIYIETVCRDDNLTVLSNNNIKTFINRHVQRTKRTETDKAQHEVLVEKIKEKVTALRGGSKLKLNGMVFTKGSVTYENQVLKLETMSKSAHAWYREARADDWTADILRQLITHFDLKDITWDQVFEKFVTWVPFVGFKGTIGTVEFNITVKTTQNKNGVENTRTYINDVRINADEIHTCLLHSICELTTEAYTKWLKTVSKCSLKFHRYLHTGIDISALDEFNSNQLKFKLPLKRFKNKNYVVLDKQEFLVKNSDKLINLADIQDLGEIATTLLTETTVEGITEKNIQVVLASAKKEHHDAIEKSLQLLKLVETKFNITRQFHNFENGKTMEGYLVKGQIDNYVIESSGKPDDKNGVYRYPSGNYVCIVDKSNAQVGADRLVNRIFALANDQKVTKEIHTI